MKGLLPYKVPCLLAGFWCLSQGHTASASSSAIAAPKLLAVGLYHVCVAATHVCAYS